MLMVLGIFIISAFWFVRSIPLAAAAAGNEPLARMTSMHRPPHGDVQVANFVTEEVLKVLQSGGGPDRSAPYEVSHSPGPQVRPHDGVEEIAGWRRGRVVGNAQHARQDPAAVEDGAAAERHGPSRVVGGDEIAHFLLDGRRPHARNERQLWPARPGTKYLAGCRGPFVVGKDLVYLDPKLACVRHVCT